MFLWRQIALSVLFFITSCPTGYFPDIVTLLTLNTVNVNYQFVGLFLTRGPAGRMVANWWLHHSPASVHLYGNSSRVRTIPNHGRWKLVILSKINGTSGHFCHMHIIQAKLDRDHTWHRIWIYSPAAVWGRARYLLVPEAPTIHL